MSKARETFSKKEKEKKKLQKRKIKQERKEERQEAAKDNTSLEDMLMYVDENGNLTETPPDPRKRKEVDADSIVLGVPKADEYEEEDGVRTGVVNYFNEEKGYGFIKDKSNGDSIFVHISGLVDRVQEGDKVTFETAMGQKGMNAVDVKLVVS